MATLLLDSDVMIDVIRNHAPAAAWFSSLGTTQIVLPGFVAMEIVAGCRDRADQQRTEKLLRRLPWIWPSETDCDRAFANLAKFRLSHGLGILDALIASTALGSGQPLATFNLKHFGQISGLSTIQPY